MASQRSAAHSVPMVRRLSRSWSGKMDVLAAASTCRLFVCLASLFVLVLGGPVAAAQGVKPTTVGVAPHGETALEFVVEISQNGPRFTLTGYLTHIQGVDDAALFTDNNPAARAEATARFTVAGTAQTTSLAEVEDRLYAVSATGTLTFYEHDRGGADFDTGRGFQSGATIATVAIRIQNVITVTSETQGLANGSGDLSVRSTSPFAIAGKSYQLGRVNGTWRISFTGPGTLKSPQPPVATIFVAGTGVSG